MRSLYRVENVRPRLGQLDWIVPLVTAGIQAGAQYYSYKESMDEIKKSKEKAAELQAAQAAAAQRQVEVQARYQATQEVTARQEAILGVPPTFFYAGAGALGLIVLLVVLR